MRLTRLLIPALALVALGLSACGSDALPAATSTGVFGPNTAGSATSSAGTPSASVCPVATNQQTGPDNFTDKVTLNPPTADGLQFGDFKVGDGASPQSGQTVSVNYTGWLQADGTKFDSSRDRGQPFQFPIGQSQVIKGWDVGVATMKVGGKRRLVIPAALGYGASGSPPTIPANATLVFDVELLSTC